MQQPPPSPTDPVRNPVLRPGLHVVRRDDRHLQVGVDPPAVLVVEDRPDTRRLLEDLRTGIRPSLRSPTAQRLVADLAARGLVIDADARDAALRLGADRAAVAAAFAELGIHAVPTLAARAGARVAVDAPDDLGQVGARLLRAGGVGVTTAAPGPGDPAPDVLLVVSDGVLPRQRLDAALRGGVPHLVVVPGPGGVQVGPFVVPGLTACLRCVDARLAERDPRRSMLLEQCGPGTSSTGPTPRDPALSLLAVSLACRDLVSFVDDARPATWSATVTVGSDLALDRREWRRHPHCGCSWDALLAG